MSVIRRPSQNATVTLAHSKTLDLLARCAEADVVAAVGSQEFQCTRQSLGEENAM